MIVDHLAGDPGETRRELCRSLVASLLSEEGVAADVGDQEGPDTPSRLAGSLIRHATPRSVAALWGVRERQHQGAGSADARRPSVPSLEGGEIPYPAKR